MRSDKNERRDLSMLKRRASRVGRPWISLVVIYSHRFDRIELWPEAVKGVNWWCETTPGRNVVVANHREVGGKQIHANYVVSGERNAPVSPIEQATEKGIGDV